MPDEPAPDVVYLHSPTEDGDGVRVVRARQGRVEVGEVRPIAEGKPLSGEIVTLRPREDAPRVCDVKVEYTTPQPAAARAEGAKGPAQVATAKYRDNWDAIFGADPDKPKNPAALN
jgi:hypothetical protein